MVLAKFILGNDINGTVLYERDFQVTQENTSEDSRISKFLFTKPIVCSPN